MPLADFFKKIEVVEQFDIAKETSNIINESGDYIVSLLKSQLRIGLDGDGQAVTVFGRDYYNDLTVFYKEKYASGLGKETSYITNYFSGNFYTSIYVYASGEEFLFDSDVPYFSQIILQSGEKIMELSKENCKLFSETILIPKLQLLFSSRFNGI